MFCPSCQHENRAGRRFCVHCGASLAALAVTFPRGFAYPFAAIASWLAVALLYRGVVLRRRRTPRPSSDET